MTKDAKSRLQANQDLILSTVTAYLPNWDHLAEPWRMVFYTSSMAQDRRYAFTLLLSPKVLEAALRSSKGPAAYLQDRLATCLKSVFPDQPIRFAFGLEWSVLEDGEELTSLHVHGALEFPQAYEVEFDKDGSVKGLVLEAVRGALRKAGGEVEEAAQARQADIEWMYNPLGWMQYLTKHRLCTLQALALARNSRGLPARRKEGLVGVTDDLRASGQELFDHMMETGVVLQVFPRPPKKTKDHWVPDALEKFLEAPSEAKPLVKATAGGLLESIRALGKDADRWLGFDPYSDPG